MDTTMPVPPTAVQTVRQEPVVQGLRHRGPAASTAQAPINAPIQAATEPEAIKASHLDVIEDTLLAIPGAFEPAPRSNKERQRLESVPLVPDYSFVKSAWTDAACMLHMAKARVIGPRDPEPSPQNRVNRAVAAIGAAHAALTDNLVKTEQLRTDAQKQLPWFVRRLSNRLGRLIIPCAVSITVVFVVLALPYVALIVGGLAGAITWFALREQDPHPYRPLPQTPPPRLKRPRLEIATLDKKLQVYKKVHDLLQRLGRVEKTDRLPEALKQVLGDYELALAQTSKQVSMLKKTAGSGLWLEPLANWGTTLAAVYVLDQVNKLMDLPLGPLWRGLCSSLSQPIMGLASIHYGRQVARNTFASTDAEHRIKADLLYVLEGEREALAHVAAILRQAMLRVEGTPTLPQTARTMLTTVFASSKNY